MTKEHLTTNSESEHNANTSEDLIANSIPPRIGPYRSLSAKRPRDPSHRKSVSFNDVPIVHEVPSFDNMRNANCDTFRSWTCADATTATSVIPSFYSSQILLPFNSTSAAQQKINANRLSSSLYSTTSSLSSSSAAVTASTATTTTTTTTTTAAATPLPTSTNTTSRIPEWAIRNKTSKPISNSEETFATNENHSTGNPPVIVVHVPDERTTKETTTVRPTSQTTYNSVYIPQPQTSSATTYSSSQNVESGEERKHPYRSAMMPDADHYRSIPFTYTPLTDSAATYTSMLSTNILQSNHSPNEHTSNTHPRAARARSATLPGSVNHSGTRASENISITPFRATPATFLPNSSNSPTRTVLRPTTIAFQCSQPNTTSMNTTNVTATAASIPTNSNGNNTNQSTATMITNAAKPPSVPSRYGSATTNSAAAHSRFGLPSQRISSASSLNASAIKYTFAHPNVDSTLNTAMLSHAASPKTPSTSYSRSRSAHVLSTRRSISSPVVMLDGHSTGGGTTTNPPASLYATAKRNPNVRQTYGSYYMHRVLLPTTIH